jgi:preprotein translocase subunit SecY
MFKTIKDAFKMKDVRRKVLFTLLLLFIYRVGCWIPIPGIDPSVFGTDGSVADTGGTRDFLQLLSDLSGGALSNGAILALGVGPYITSSIVMQLLTIAIPALERLNKQGDEGRRKIAVYTRYVALAMSLAQAIAIVIAFGAADDMLIAIFGQHVPAPVVGAMVVLTLVAGSMFTVWIGDKITEHGVSNGMSMLIFVGIISTGVGAFYSSIGEAFGFVGDEGMNLERLWIPITFVAVLLFIFFTIVFVDLAERRIPVNYAKQVKGNKMYGGQSQIIPLKINATGVIPIIFAFSMLQFPQLIMSIVAPESDAYIWYAEHLGAGTPVNIILTSLLILGFTFFYATLAFNPDDVAKQLQQNGGMIYGYRPGQPTRDYLKRVSSRITLFGAIFLAVIALVPSLIFETVVPEGGMLLNAFTSIGLLIIVSVALEFDKQLQGQMMMKQYKGFLK